MSLINSGYSPSSFLRLGRSTVRKVKCGAAEISSTHMVGWGSVHDQAASALPAVNVPSVLSSPGPPPRMAFFACIAGCKICRDSRSFAEESDLDEDESDYSMSIMASVPQGSSAQQQVPNVKEKTVSKEPAANKLGKDSGGGGGTAGRSTAERASSSGAATEGRTVLEAEKDG